MSKVPKEFFVSLSFLLVLLPSIAQALSQKDLQKFVPQGYRLVKYVQGDLNQDKKPDIVLGVESQKPPYGTAGTPLAKIIVLLRQGNELKKFWVFSDGDSNLIGRHDQPDKDYIGWIGEPTLIIGDLNWDGKPELIFSLTVLGASEGWVSTYVFAFDKDKFVSLADGPFGHPLDGGVRFKDFNSSKIGKEILVYEYIWGEDEIHAEPHRYLGKFYGWDPKSQKYKLYKKMETTQKGKAGLKELFSVSE